MLKRVKKEKKISLKTKNKKHKIKSKNKKEKDIFDNVPELLDILVPDCVQEKMDKIILGDERYSRTFVLAIYPSKTWLGWLDGIFSKLGDINLSIQVETVSDDSVIRQLTKKVTVLESELQTYQARGNINIVHPLQRMLYDYEGIRQQIQMSEDKLFFITILFRINAKNTDELNNKTNLLKNEFAKMSAKVRTLNFRQLEGLRANLPLNSSNILDYERNVTADGLATMFPISNSNAESSPEGIIIGRNYFTGLPVYLDTFSKDLANPHLCILGESGAGKSVTMDIIGSRSVVILNRQLAILDNEGEYKKRTDSLSGRIIKIRQGVASGINLFDIELDENDNGIEKVDILGKVAEIRALLAGIMNNYMGRTLNAKELVDIESAVIETYKEKGITQDKDSLYEKDKGELNGKITLNRIKKKMPTLTDFQRILSTKKNSNELAEILTGFLRGKSLGIFDCPSTVNTNDQLLEFDLSEISDEVTKFYANLVITTWILEKYMKKNAKYPRKAVHIDEAWTIIKYKETANFVETLARKARKKGVSLVIATQSPDELVSSPQGRAILNNCDTTLLMKQSPMSVDKVIEHFKLADGTRDFLLKCQPGEALLNRGGTVSAVSIEMLEREKDIIKL